MRLQPLTHHLQAKLVEAAKRGQVRASEDSVKHVEVFRVGGVGTSIIGRPRPLPRDRRADQSYTPNCEEPIILRVSTGRSRFDLLTVGHAVGGGGQQLPVQLGQRVVSRRAEFANALAADRMRVSVPGDEEL